MTGTIKLAGAQWTWVGTSFAESAGIYKTLGVEAMDLIAMPGAALTADGLTADPQGQAKMVKDLDIELVNLIVLLGEGFADRALEVFGGVVVGDQRLHEEIDARANSNRAVIF